MKTVSDGDWARELVEAVAERDRAALARAMREMARRIGASGAKPNTIIFQDRDEFEAAVKLARRLGSPSQ